MEKVNFQINAKQYSTAKEEKTLLWYLRDDAKLKGTKFGCGKGLCGACTVKVNGEAVRSCQTMLSELSGAKVETIESLGDNHPLFVAWKKYNVPQCGYCQPGQIMSASALLDKNKRPTSEQVSEHMSGNICRCGTYQRISNAIQNAGVNS